VNTNFKGLSSKIKGSGHNPQPQAIKGVFFEAIAANYFIAPENSKTYTGVILDLY